MIEETKSAPFRVDVTFVQLSGNRNISDRCVHPAPAVDLKDPARRYRPDRREIPRTTGIDIMRPVKAPHHVRITKCADQSLIDPVILHRSQGGIGWLHFTSVRKFKPAQLQAGVVSL